MTTEQNRDARDSETFDLVDVNTRIDAEAQMQAEIDAEIDSRTAAREYFAAFKDEEWRRSCETRVEPMDDDRYPW